MQKSFAFLTLTVGIFLLAACGGGGGGAPTAAGGSGGSGTSGALGTLTVSAASNSARNGNYAVTGAKFNSGADSGFNGSNDNAAPTFETEIVWASNATAKRAHLWFYNGASIKYFGCDGTNAIPCTGVGYEPLLKQVLFNNVVWHEVTPDLTGATPDVLVSSGETLTVNGKLDVK